MKQVPQETWEAGKYTCHIRQVPGLGILCGYIGLPKDHPDFGKHYNELMAGYEVHGGLTFSYHSMPSINDNRDKWWIGFDCAHFSDFIPKIPETCEPVSTWKDVGFVKKEIDALISQARKRENK